jgi:hypothetical protein
MVFIHAVRIAGSGVDNRCSAAVAEAVAKKFSQISR